MEQPKDDQPDEIDLFIERFANAMVEAVILPLRIEICENAINSLRGIDERSKQNETGS